MTPSMAIPRPEVELTDRAIAELRTDARVGPRHFASFLQRRLALGYNQAVRIQERLAVRGILTLPDATGRRDLVA
jgi:DNA segregation ATPase FtsK/SpoIIIE-like protein